MEMSFLRSAKCFFEEVWISQFIFHLLSMNLILCYTKPPSHYTTVHGLTMVNQHEFEIYIVVLPKPDESWELEDPRFLNRTLV